jgi:protein-tyrosine phosphatase
VSCSRWLSRPDRWDDTALPDFGVYLDPAWDGVPWTHDLVAWPDFGVIAADAVAALARRIVGDAAMGQVVDIGCLGGHGRTGTLLAVVIGIGEQLDPADAFGAARERYCPRAIETVAQAQLVFEALGGAVPPAEAFVPGSHGRPIL